MRLSVIALLASASLAGLIAGQRPASAGPITIGGKVYSASGPSESLSVPFTMPIGAVTSGTYSHFVEVMVSGTGMSLGTDMNDAFYVYAPGPPVNDPVGYYQLGFGTNTSPLFAFDSSKAARNAIVYDVTAGTAVTPPYVPAFNPSHTYDVVIDAGALPDHLQFGVTDGDFADNSGAYAITVTQLGIGVPEPASLALLAAGLVGLAVSRRRRACPS